MGDNGRADFAAHAGNPVQEKSYAYAIRIVHLYQYLSTERKEFILSKQLLRSGTSIGANVEEAIGGFSKKEFASKMGIAYKEARESSYWLRLLKDTGYLDMEAFQSIHGDCDELLRILNAIARTSKSG